MNKMILFSFVMLVFSPTESHTMAHELMARVPDIINAVSGRASIDRQTNDEYTKVLEAISASLETVVTEKDCLNQTLNLTLIDEKDKNKALLSQIDELNETLEQVIVGNEELYKDKKKLVEELAKVTVAKEKELANLKKKNEDLMAELEKLKKNHEVSPSTSPKSEFMNPLSEDSAS